MNLSLFAPFLEQTHPLLFLMKKSKSVQGMYGINIYREGLIQRTPSLIDFRKTGTEKCRLKATT